MTVIDQFWDVRAQEAQEERSILDQIDSIQRAINLGRRSQALKNAAGFQDFLKAVTDLHTHALKRLAVSPFDDAALREQRGRVQALRDVLAVLERADTAVTQLAAQEQELQNQLKAVRHARPKPRSE